MFRYGNKRPLSIIENKKINATLIQYLYWSFTIIYIYHLKNYFKTHIRELVGKAFIWTWERFYVQVSPGSWDNFHYL